MVNFANVKQVEIPEGIVKQINRGATVLWQSDTFSRDYQKVAWIKSDTNSWINTNYVPTNDTKVEFVNFTYTNVSSWWRTFCASNDSDGGDNTYWVRLITGSNYLGCAMGNINNSGSYYSNYYVVTTPGITYSSVEFSKDGLYVNGNIGTKVKDVQNITATKPLLLFCKYDGNNPGAAGAILQLGGFKIYENNVLVKDFIPCYRKSDNEIGMYDTIGKQFYTNQGTGTFTKGGDIE